jgi:hypothetical protein
MASENGSSTGIVAIFAILILAMIGGFIAWQAGVFGNGNNHHGSSEHKVDVDVNKN